MATADLSSDCYYKNLGLDRNATEQEIKAAYRKLALKWHPDKNRENPEAAECNFKKVNEAYDCLTDPKKKQIFDMYGKRGLDSSGGCGGGATYVNAQDIFQRFFSEGGFQDDFGGFPGMGGMGGGGFSFSFGGGDPFGGDPFANHFRSRPCASKHNRAPPPSGPDIIPTGIRCIVFGLESSPHYNNLEATISSYDRCKGRYRVFFGEDNSNTISIKPTNFSQLVERVKLTGIVSRPQLNGCSGNVVGYNSEQQRHSVRLDGSASVVSVMLSNLILPNGARAHVQCLKSGEKYNGSTGKIIEYDTETERYLVELADGKQLRIKVDNLRI